jgi:ATP-binding cassette subfamily C (CFTR/MRP) protein 1
MITSVVLNWTQLETSITAVARVIKFAKVTPPEENRCEVELASDWPRQGSVEFQNLSATHK